MFAKPTDPASDTLSPDAVQIAELLSITDKVKRVQNLLSKTKSEARPDLASRQELTEAKLDVIEVIEQTRLDIDFVSAEIEEETAGGSELYQAYTTERDNRINRLNAYGFRTNGVLWAVAEGLDIPTYNRPKYSIPSGSIGIVAGLVPSLFSLWALRSLPGENYDRIAYPNMLTKLFGFPTVPRIEYPESVWQYLNAKPSGEAVKTRIDIMIAHWLEDKNLPGFTKKDSQPQKLTLCGHDNSHLTLGLVSQRLVMLRELRAVVAQMNRPLLELSMVVRGRKRFVEETALPPNQPPNISH